MLLWELGAQDSNVFGISGYFFRILSWVEVILKCVVFLTNKYIPGENEDANPCLSRIIKVFIAL